MAQWAEQLAADRQQIEEGGGTKAAQRQHAKGRLTARERIDRLIDPDTPLLEIGLYNAFGMYESWGGAPAAGVVTVIGTVRGRRHMIVANDATVKAGAFFPATAKKVLRAQRIAFRNRLPLIYLVDSSGIFLPLQEDVFPDDDDFGRIFRNNSVLSAAGISQIAAVMGNCVAGGSYLPVLCDKILMTDGSGLYLAGPALVKSAIGQQATSDELGGAEMHATVSGTIDYREVNDEACLDRLRKLVADQPPDHRSPYLRLVAAEPAAPTEQIHKLSRADAPLDIRDELPSLVDRGSLDLYNVDPKYAILCATARVGGFSVGLLANRPAAASIASTDMAARFIDDCHRQQRPMLLLLNQTGLLAGGDAHPGRGLRANNALLDALVASRVPKITLYIDGSCGANHFGACGRAHDPRFIFAWPAEESGKGDGANLPPRPAEGRGKGNGANLPEWPAGCSAQISPVPFSALTNHLQQQGDTKDAQELSDLAAAIPQQGDAPSDVRTAAARGWIDAVIDPAETRSVLIAALEIATRCPDQPLLDHIQQV